MRIRNTYQPAEQRSELKMTAMIDVVFLLLIFFVATFRIVSPEADFQISMPLRQGSDTRPDLLSVTVRLTADADGRLSGITLGERPIESFEQLRRQVRSLIDDSVDPLAVVDGLQLDLICDEHLNFEHAVEAIAAVSGYVDDGHIVKLIEKIRFLPTGRRAGDR